MNSHIQLGDLIKSISQTHKFDKEELIFLNTSDVLAGKILSSKYTKISELKGQAKKTIKNGDILYSEIRPKNRRYAYVKNIENIEDYVVSTKLMVLRNFSKNLDTDYLYHFLTFEKTLDYLQQMAENRIGSFPQITFDVLKTLKIWLPDLSIQQQIASVLSSLDAKIELNNRINAELEAMAKTLYDYWFVQFDFPNEHGKPYKSSGGKMVYNKELKREIPEGWEVGKLSDIAKIITGKLDSNAEVRGGEYPFFTCAANPTTIDSYGYDETAILVAGNNAGGNFHVNRHKGKFNAYQRTYIITAKDEKFFEFIYEVIKIETLLLKRRGQGSQTKFLTLKMLTDIKILIATNKVMENFYLKVKSIFLQQMNLSEQNQHLASLRDWLLPMLMNGQVTIKEAEEKVKETFSLAEQSPAIAAEKEGEYNTGQK